MTPCPDTLIERNPIMSSPTWVLQTNISSADSEDKLYRFLTQAGIPVQSYILVPFDDSPLPFTNDQPTIFYGSTSLLRRVKREHRWKPGVWYNVKASNFETLKENYGKELLNYHSRVMTLDEFMGFPWVDDLPLFVRPTEDTKSIIGAVRTFGEWKERLQGSIGVRGGPDPGTPIQVAIPQEINREWRVCILDGKPITASTYRVEGKRDQGGDVPQKVLDYARDMARVYSPQPVFMLDVCELGDESLRIIETNCFNCSGFYWMDVYEIANRVTEYVQERYGHD